MNQQLYAEVQRLTDWDITLVVPSNWRDEYGRVKEALRLPTFEGQLIAVPVRLSGNIILHTYRTSFAKLLQKIDPDVIYVNHEPYALATAQVFWANYRSGHSRPIGFYSCQNIRKRYPIPFRWMESWVLKSSAFAFPISTTVDEVFRNKGYQGLSAVLPLAIDPDVYRPSPDGDEVRQELMGDNATPDDVLIGYVGRFVPAKGLATLLRAVSRLSDLRWRLAFVGAGEMEAELRHAAASAGLSDRIVFTGFVPHTEVPRLLSAMDILVLPSETQSNWKEQFGRVLLEAMACGTPVVGSDSGEIPVLIRDTGGGLIFRERDAEDLASCLRKLITNSQLRQVLADTGRAAVAARYTMADAAKVFARMVETATSLKHDRDTQRVGRFIA